MKKPKPTTSGIYDYHNCIKYLEKKLKKDFRDWADTEGHEQSWITKHKKRSL